MCFFQLIPDSKDWLDLLAAFGPIAAVIAIIINVLLTNRAIKKADLRQTRSDTYRQIQDGAPAYRRAIDAFLSRLAEISRIPPPPARENSSDSLKSSRCRAEIAAELDRSFKILEQEMVAILLLVSSARASDVFGKPGKERFQEIDQSVRVFHNEVFGSSGDLAQLLGTRPDDPAGYLEKTRAKFNAFSKSATKHRDDVTSDFLWLVGADTFKGDHKKNPNFILRAAESRPPGQNRESGSAGAGKANDTTE